ncbi:hypothetical protein EJ110_NYTH01952 [Nymphaea thermarum]|nr:hypothetical protein EJ110_NYTH01952 [Nymphaea thermarum]
MECEKQVRVRCCFVKFYGSSETHEEQSGRKPGEAAECKVWLSLGFVPDLRQLVEHGEMVIQIASVGSRNVLFFLGEEGPFAFYRIASLEPNSWILVGFLIDGYLRSLLQFLVDQPGELRYLEWPSFKSTLKTAILTLVLVALLIVALSSIDAALWYLLALILRRAA